jgi:hypothetical protein
MIGKSCAPRSRIRVESSSSIALTSAFSPKLAAVQIESGAPLASRKFAIGACPLRQASRKTETPCSSRVYASAGSRWSSVRKIFRSPARAAARKTCEPVRDTVASCSVALKFAVPRMGNAAEALSQFRRLARKDKTYHALIAGLLLL